MEVQASFLFSINSKRKYFCLMKPEVFVNYPSPKGKGLVKAQID